MQIVGRRCQICHAALNFHDDGLGCAACDQVFCKDCLEDASTCKTCGADLRDQENPRQSRKKEDAKRARSASAYWFYPWVIAVVALSSLGAAISDIGSGRPAASWLLDVGVFIICFLLIVDFRATGIPIFLKRKRDE